MKRMRLFAAVAALLALALNTMQAQRYEPKTTWPYIYSEFQEGTVRTTDGKLFSYDKLNVSVVDGKLHYIDTDKNVIMQSDMKLVNYATIGEDTFVNFAGAMVQVLAENDNGMIIQKTVVDTDQMDKADIGYGISSATATSHNVSLLRTEGSLDMAHKDFATVLGDRSKGEVLPVKTKMFVRIGLRSFPASKRGLSEDSGVDKASIKAFLKENKIDWKSPESMLSVVDFVSSKK